MDLDGRLTADDWRLVEFYERVRLYRAHVRDLEADRESYYELLDLAQVRAALQTSDVPAEDWPRFAAAAEFLFEVEKDLHDAAAFADDDVDG